MSRIQNVSRRGFLKGVLSGGAFVLGAYFVSGRRAGGPDWQTLPPIAQFFIRTCFLGIETDGTVYIIAHRSEMGNGSRTALPRVLADELDADWNRVKIVQAVGDPRYGSQDTDASRSIREFFDLMREAGATARLMLVRAAAGQWAVPASECESGLHVVVHLPTRRQSRTGNWRSPPPDCLSRGKKTCSLSLEPRGAILARTQVSTISRTSARGQAVYGMDARLEGMVYASVERPPVLGGKVKSCQDQEALRVPGVRQTVLIEPFKPPHGFQPLGGRGGDRRQHLGGISRPQETECGLGSRAECCL